MAFLSYAQNFEDVMLWRALGHIPNGVYVDVGAQHPRIDSISRAFYEHGWRGTHIEPVPAFAEMLRQDRPDETVLQLAIGAADGILELNVFADTGLSTAIRDYAERHQNERGYEVQRIQVPVLTLNTALGSLEGKDVHWLKIDVEGFEEQVLRGWRSERLRPWVLVVEATIPNSPETDYENWDPLVTAAGYRFVYFDGLNRFYIADEHAELADAFLVPPNIFDAVEVSGQASWGLCDNVAAGYEGRLAGYEGRVADYEAKLNDFKVRVAGDEAKLADLGGQLAQAERELAAERERNSTMHAQAATLREEHEAARRALGSSVVHVEWMQGQHDAQAQRLNAHIASIEQQRDTEEKRLHAHIAWMEERLEAAQRSGHEANAQAETLRQQVHALQASTSWRLTAPLRRATDLARRIKRKLRGDPAPIPQAAQVMYAASAKPDEQAPRELSPRAARILEEIRTIIDARTN